jgi:hypothetical protein
LAFVDFVSVYIVLPCQSGKTALVSAFSGGREKKNQAPGLV